MNPVGTSFLFPWFVLLLLLFVFPNFWALHTLTSCFCRFLIISLAWLLNEYAFACQSSVLSILTFFFFPIFVCLLLSIALLRFNLTAIAMWSLYTPSPLLLALDISLKCYLKWIDGQVHIIFSLQDESSINFVSVVEKCCCWFEVVKVHEVSFYLASFISEFVSVWSFQIAVRVKYCHIDVQPYYDCVWFWNLFDHLSNFVTEIYCLFIHVHACGMVAAHKG